MQLDESMSQRPWTSCGSTTACGGSWSTWFGEWETRTSARSRRDRRRDRPDRSARPRGAGEETRFWRALDRDVNRTGVPIHVLVTVFWHTRSAAADGRALRRAGARVSGARARRSQRRAGAVDDDVSRRVTASRRSGGPLPTASPERGGPLAPARIGRSCWRRPSRWRWRRSGCCPQSWLPDRHSPTSELRASLQPTPRAPGRTGARLARGRPCSSGVTQRSTSLRGHA